MRFIHTRNQYIGVILFALALLALEVLRIPTPMSLGWYDCVPSNQNGHCFVPTHFWGVSGFSILFFTGVDLYFVWKIKIRD